MSQETAFLKQDAVLWAFDGEAYDDYGDATMGAATAIKVRWEEEKRETTDAQGNTVTLDATVYVDRDITVDSRIRLGAKDDLPSPVVDQRKVISFEKIPDTKGRKFTRVVEVVKFHKAAAASA